VDVDARRPPEPLSENDGHDAESEVRERVEGLGDHVLQG